MDGEGERRVRRGVLFVLGGLLVVMVWAMWRSWPRGAGPYAKRGVHVWLDTLTPEEVVRLTATPGVP